MATHIFKVKADKDAVSVEHSVEMTVGLEAEDWEHLVAGTDDDILQRVLDLAIDAWTVKCQAFLRKNSDKDAAAFRYGLKTSRTRVVVQKVRIDATAMKLNREQIDALVAEGAEVYNIPEELI